MTKSTTIDNHCCPAVSWSKRRRNIENTYLKTWHVMALLYMGSIMGAFPSSSRFAFTILRSVSAWIVQPLCHPQITRGSRLMFSSTKYSPIAWDQSVFQSRHSHSLSFGRRPYHQLQPKYRQPLSDDDEQFLTQAVQCAKIGKGHTFPNPAVGCVIVRNDTNEVLGSGFHPRAGFPHAEIFALLEAAGHIDSGIDAARSVVNKHPDPTIEELTQTYISTETRDDGRTGPSILFEGCFDHLKNPTSSVSTTNDNQDTTADISNGTDNDGPPTSSLDATDIPGITAYVTLEPCCHYGRTPPCAQTLALAGVDRVVVGYRDPNPRVDGGGVKALQDQGVVVDMAGLDDDRNGAGQACGDLVENFVKRIVPKLDYDDIEYSHITGAMRRSIRAHANRKKTDKSLTQVNWTSKATASTDDGVNELVLEPEWMERLDDTLWKNEVVNLRLNNAVGKKKLALHLGRRIAKELGAHVAQNIGHTVLLYRPSIPPVLDLEEMVSSSAQDEED